MPGAGANRAMRGGRFAGQRGAAVRAIVEGDMDEATAVEPRKLSSFFSDEGPKEPVAETPPNPEPANVDPPAPEPDGQARVPKGEPGGGRFAAKKPGGDGADASETDVSAPDPEAKPDGSPPPDASKGLESTVLGERRRRQDAERRMQEQDQRIQFLESQLQSLQQPKPGATAESEPEPDPDFWADPKAFLGRQFDQFGEALLDRFERRQRDQAIDKAEATARAKYDDYDEITAAFHQAAAANHALIREMLAADDPAEFAYRKGKGIRQLSEVGDLDQLKAQLREEWEAELRSRSPSPPAPALPQSTATERSASVPRTGPQWEGPKPLRAYFDH